MKKPLTIRGRGTAEIELRRMRVFAAFLVFLVLPVKFVQPVHAQVTTADVLGTVVDQSGAVVPGAKVTLRNLGTGVVASTSSNEVGNYIFNLLIPGQYSLEIEANGFKKIVYADIALAAGDRAREDARLSTGSIEETVTVSAEPPLLQTDSSTVTSVVTEQSVQDLPLNGRNYVNLVTVQPGVNQGQADALTDGFRGDDRRDTSVVVANGQSDSHNNNMVDGMDNNNLAGDGGDLAVRPSIDAIAEVKVDTNNYSAEVGRNAGAVINVITKSGSDTFHGSAYEFFRNDIFDARDFFTTVTSGVNKPEYRQNQFGGSIGGPIVRNKSFFFGDVEDSRRVQGVSSGLLTVPTAYEEASGGTDFTDNGGGIVPASAISAPGLAYFKMNPRPNTGPAGALTNNYISAFNSTKDSLTFDGRIDEHFNNGDQFFARYSYNNVGSYIPGAFPAVNIGGMTVWPNGTTGWPGPSTTKVHGVELQYVHMFSPKLVTELKAGYTRFQTDTYGPNNGKDVSAALGIINANTSVAPQTSGMMPVYFLSGGYSVTGDACCFPILNTSNIFQYMGALTYTHGAHNLKTGVQLIRHQENYFQSAFPMGAAWVAALTGNAMEDLVTGQALAYYRSQTLVQPGFRNWEYSGYLQDDWRVTRSLTLNLGLRYEVFTAWNEVQNRTANFDYPTLSIITGSQSPHIGIDTRYSNFGPRIGFSQSLWKGAVLRGGFGISYYPLSTLNELSGFALSNPPYNYNSGFIVNPGWWPVMPIPTPSSTTNLSGGLSYVPSDFNTSYVQQFNLMAQQEIGANVFTVGGLGELTRHELWGTTINTPSPNGPYANDATQGPPPPQPYLTTNSLPNVSGIGVQAPWGTANYYALQAVFVRRLSRGFAFNANYTLGHGLSNAFLGTGTGGQGGGLIANDPHYDYGNSEVDIRHRYAMNWSYQLPIGRNASGGKALLLKGWESNFLLFWQTGQSFAVTDGWLNTYGVGQINLVATSGDRPSVVQGQSFKASSSPSIQNWLNAAAFTPQAAGTAGDEKEGALYGPHTRRADLSFFKNFNLTERVNAQFRAECYNISNTPNFMPPNGNISSWNPGPQHDATHPISLPATGPCSVSGACSAVGLLPGDVATNAGGFGTITSTVPNVANRQFQFAFKLLF